ncbi:MAG: hypothetical protein ABI867_22515 [Kofleriaceae bacterium]
MERLGASIGTGSGRTSVTLELDGERAVIVVESRWMGQAPLVITFACAHRRPGMIRIESAASGETAVPLPPNPDGLYVQYVRVAAQPDPFDQEADPFTMVAWLDPEAYFDDGTQLSIGEYEHPPESFKPAVDALVWLERPWKLA